MSIRGQEQGKVGIRLVLLESDPLQSLPVNGWLKHGFSPLVPEVELFETEVDFRNWMVRQDKAQIPDAVILEQLVTWSRPHHGTTVTGQDERSVDEGESEGSRGAGMRLVRELQEDPRFAGMPTILHTILTPEDMLAYTARYPHYRKFNPAFESPNYMYGPVGFVSKTASEVPLIDMITRMVPRLRSV